jgi:hypothetical protein
MNIVSICRVMMEDGFYPHLEQNHVLFNIDDNPATLEYEAGIMTVRIFFSIDEDSYEMFLKAGNATMTGTMVVKHVVLSERKILMFSSETMCDTLKEFRKFLPKSIELIRDAVTVHRHEMKSLLKESMLYKDLYTHDDEYDTAHKFCS